MTTYRFDFSLDGTTIATLPVRDCADDVTALELAQALIRHIAVAVRSGERQVAEVGCDGNSVTHANENHFADASQPASKVNVASKM